MKKSGELLCLRYLALIVILFQVISIESKSSWISITLVLILFLSNNLRVFYIRKEKLAYISILAEIIFCIFLYSIYGGSIVFYFIGVIIDLFEGKKEVINYTLLTIIYIFTIIISYRINQENGFFALIFLSLIYLVLNYISKLYSTKKESQRLYDKLRISEKKLMEANEELRLYASTIEEVAVLKERNRISREIHDSVGHTLSTAMIQLSAMERIGEKDGSYLGEMAKNIREFIGNSFSEVERAVRELKPEGYKDIKGVIRLVDVCKTFEKLSGVKVKLNVSKERWTLTNEQSQNLYRITQEVLSNALRHGKASEIKVILNFLSDKLIVSFKDNGIGTKTIKETGVGLISIKERVSELNGTINITSEENQGFFIKIVIPKGQGENNDGED